MKNRMLRSLKFVLAASFIGAALGSRADELKPGQPAPDFKLKGSDGKTYQLSDFKGKKAVVLAWFPKAFTPGCTAECKSFRADGDKMRQFNAAYFTASCDDAETNKKFGESLGVDYPILSDPSGETARAYGVVDDQRRAPRRWTYYIGKNGDILYIDKSVQTRTHGSDVAAKLEELGVEKKG